MDTSLPIITDRKLRMAMLGCGRISKNHFDAINQFSDDMELVAVCDVYAPSAEEAAAKYNVPSYTDLDDLLANDNIDIVIICTPSGLHARQALKIAQAGKHIITEKPMATLWRDALSMVSVADYNNVRLFVVKQNRRNATIQLVKNAIDQGRFGRIFMVNSNVFWTRPQDYYDQAPWRGSWEFDGGVLTNQASHYVDLLQWLVGPVDSMHAMSATQDRKIEAEDSIVLNMRWRSGCLGSMNVTVLTYPKNFEGSITLIGEKGTVRIGGVAVNEIQHWEFSDSRPEDADIVNASYETTSVYGFGHPAYYENVIQVMRGEAQPDTDGREGLKSLEIITAAYESARTGQVVGLPLERR